MSGSIHKEALADAKKLREIAENNAKNVILERITPTIKNMIEKELLGESSSGMEEDILISPDDEEKEEKEESDKKVEENIQLTTESIQELVKMSGARSEHYGVRSLRLANKIEKLHEAKINESTYTEKLRQIKTEIEKTYKDLQEDIKKNIVPSGSSELIIKNLEESWEITNNLMIPVKVRLINESNKKLSKKIGKFKVIAEDYSLTKEAKKRFGKECIKLTKETKALYNSVAELKEVVKDSKVDKVQDKITGLFKEIYIMARKFGSLNEEELKIVISGFNTEDPEGSALSAMVEPVEDELGDDDMDDMDMDDDLGGDDLGGDEMGMGDEMDMDEFSMYESEEALDELLGRQYQAAGGRGRTGKSGARSHITPEERASQEKRGADLADQERASREERASSLDEEALDELLGKQYQAAGGRGRTGKSGARSHLSPDERASQEKRGAALAQKEKESQMDEDEMLEISEAMLKQELLRLKKRRAAMNEDAMKAMQHSPGGGPDHFDNFGGAGRNGGGVEGDLFQDYGSDDLNDLDPVGTGYPVNEGEAVDEYVRDAGKAYQRARTRSLQKADADKKKKEDKKEDKEKVDESTINHELVETLRVYKGALGKLRNDSKKLQEELRKSNLSNAKLVYATRLMQNENLSNDKRRKMLEKLDEAKSVKEVKSIFTVLSAPKSKLTESVEGRNILGGSSKATKAGGSSLNESEQKEFARWGELAGCKND